jgi:hypothetical protein
MKLLVAMLSLLGLGACTQNALRQSLYDSANNRGSMHCETLPDTERVKCKERESVQYRDYKQQRDIAMGTAPAASRSESFDDYQKRRE